MSYQRLKDVHKLQVGQWVWLQRRESALDTVGEVVKVTNTQVHISRLNRHGRGTPIKFHRLDGLRFAAGDEQASHWMSDHIHSIATTQDVRRERRKVSAINRAERVREARQKATERRVEKLRGLFPAKADVNVGSITEDETKVTYNLRICGLTMDQLLILHTRLRNFPFPEVE